MELLCCLFARNLLLTNVKSTITNEVKTWKCAIDLFSLSDFVALLDLLSEINFPFDYFI